MNWIIFTSKVLPYVSVKVRSKGSIRFIKDLILLLLGRYLLPFLSWISESIYTFWFSSPLAWLERGTFFTHFPLISKCYSNWLIKLFSFFSPILTTTTTTKSNKKWFEFFTFFFFFWIPEVLTALYIASSSYTLRYGPGRCFRANYSNFKLYVIEKEKNYNKSLFFLDSSLNTQYFVLY